MSLWPLTPPTLEVPQGGDLQLELHHQVPIQAASRSSPTMGAPCRLRDCSSFLVFAR